MSSSRIDNTRATVQVQPARARQTEAPATPFRNVLAGGASALLTGAEVATSVMAGPVLAAAVRETRADVVDAIAGGPAGGDGSMGPASAAATSNPLGDPLADARALQRESQHFNMHLLRFQEEVQNENRRFTMLSNVCRARHDTASACVKNIH